MADLRSCLKIPAAAAAAAAADAPATPDQRGRLRLSTSFKRHTYTFILPLRRLQLGVLQFGLVAIAPPFFFMMRSSLHVLSPARYRAAMHRRRA